MTQLIKISGFELPEPDDAGDRTMLTNIRKHGWHVWMIPADEEGPGFSYTVGVYLRSLQPEILVMGLPSEPAHGLLNALAEFQVSGGSLPLDTRFEVIARAPPVWLRPLHVSHYREYLGSAIWLYRSLPKAFPALQCFWPDPSGRFPHEAGVDKRYAEVQRDLSQARP